MSDGIPQFFNSMMTTLLRLFLLFTFIFAPDLCVAEEDKSVSVGEFVYKTEYREDGSLERIVKLDKRGKKLTEVFYGPDGKLAKNPVDNWAAATWEYVDGKLVEQRYYGTDGRLKERKSYTPAGNLKEKDYLGGGIDENEELDTEFMAADEVSKYFDAAGSRLEGEMESLR